MQVKTFRNIGNVFTEIEITSLIISLEHKNSNCQSI